MRMKNEDRNRSNKMFKYELGQLVYYLKDNKRHSAPIISRMIVENKYDHFDRFQLRIQKNQFEFFNRFGESVIMYATCHGEFKESDLFSTKSLRDKKIS